MRQLAILFHQCFLLVVSFGFNVEALVPWKTPAKLTIEVGKAEDLSPHAVSRNERQQPRYASVTLKYLSTVHDSIEAYWMGILSNAETMRIIAQNTMARDIRIIVSVASYVAQRSRMDTQLVLSTTQRLLALPDSIGARPQLLGAFQTPTTALRVEKMNQLKLTPAAVSDALRETLPIRAYRALHTMPATTSYQYRLSLYSPSALRALVLSKVRGYSPPLLRLPRPPSSGRRRGPLLRDERLSVREPHTGVPVHSHVTGRHGSGHTVTPVLQCSGDGMYDVGVAGISALQNSKPVSSSVIIDTTAESSDLLDEKIVRTALLLLDMLLYAVETVLTTILPAAVQGGAQVLERVAQALYVRERMRTLGVRFTDSSSNGVWRTFEHFSES